jgi:phage-related minor tail protein
MELAGSLTPTNSGSTPVPDPTALTTEALRREIQNLKEQMESKLDAAKELRDEKFNSVDDKLDLGERQRVEQKADTEKAITAALEAQKEAANKSEAAVAKQLEQMQNTFKTEIGNLTTNMSDIKDRVGKMEAVKLGVSEQRVEGRTTTAGLYAAIGIAVTLVLAVLSVIAFTQG